MICFVHKLIRIYSEPKWEKEFDSTYQLYCFVYDNILCDTCKSYVDKYTGTSVTQHALYIKKVFETDCSKILRVEITEYNA